MEAAGVVVGVGLYAVVGCCVLLGAGADLAVEVRWRWCKVGVRTLGGEDGVDVKVEVVERAALRHV